MVIKTLAVISDKITQARTTFQLVDTANQLFDGAVLKDAMTEVAKDVHIRTGLAVAAEPAEKEDENYGLDVGAQTNEDGDTSKDEDAKKPKDKKAGK